MFKILKCSTTGVTEYCITKEEDIEKLPKRGLSIGSTAQLINSDGLRVFMFTQESGNIDGEWIELQEVSDLNLAMVIALIKKYTNQIRDSILMHSPNGSEFVITVNDNGEIIAKEINYLIDKNGNNIATKNDDKLICK